MHPHTVYLTLLNGLALEFGLQARRRKVAPAVPGFNSKWDSSSHNVTIFRVRIALVVLGMIMDENVAM